MRRRKKGVDALEVEGVKNILEDILKPHVYQLFAPGVDFEKTTGNSKIGGHQQWQRWRWVQSESARKIHCLTCGIGL